MNQNGMMMPSTSKLNKIPLWIKNYNSKYSQLNFKIRNVNMSNQSRKISA